VAPFSQALLYLVQSIGSLYLMVVVLRFLLQTLRADFYNPISQFVVKLTHPLVKPMRRVIPPIGPVDTSVVILALLVQTIIIQMSNLLLGGQIVGLLATLIWGLIGILNLIFNFYFFGLFVVIVLSWIAPYNRHPAILLLHQLIDPVMAPFRRLLPSAGGLDFSPILMIIVIQMFQILLRGMGNAVHLIPLLVPGI